MDDFLDKKYISFWLVGIIWLASLVLIPIFKIADGGRLLKDTACLELAYGGWIILALILAAVEDYIYDTRHVRVMIVLCIVMNFLMSALITMGAIALVAGALIIAAGIIIGPETVAVSGFVLSWLGLLGPVVMAVVCICLAMAGFMVGGV